MNADLYGEVFVSLRGDLYEKLFAIADSENKSVEDLLEEVIEDFLEE